MTEVLFFKTPADLRKWFEKNHDKVAEQWIGFYKRDSGKPSITWPESVDEALCFGWIDGLRKSINEISYKIRFTPRKHRSIWSAVNSKRALELIEKRRMHRSGLNVFENRDIKRSGIYSYEQKKHSFDAAFQKRFRANKQAWNFFRAQPPWYQRVTTYWVMSAKKDETRLRRLTTLIEQSANERVIRELRRTKK